MLDKAGLPAPEQLRIGLPEKSNMPEVAILVTHAWKEAWLTVIDLASEETCVDRLKLIDPLKLGPFIQFPLNISSVLFSPVDMQLAQNLCLPGSLNREALRCLIEQLHATPVHYLARLSFTNVQG